MTGKAMSEKTDFNCDGLDLDMARRIDLICRRFEAEWRERRQPEAPRCQTWRLRGVKLCFLFSVGQIAADNLYVSGRPDCFRRLVHLPLSQFQSDRRTVLTMP